MLQTGAATEPIPENLIEECVFQPIRCFDDHRCLAAKVGRPRERGLSRSRLYLIVAQAVEAVNASGRTGEGNQSFNYRTPAEEQFML